MTTQAEALARILSRIRALPARMVSLVDAVGSYAERDIIAPLSLPPFDNSAMDGYAVVASSCAVGQRLRVTGEQPAGPDRQLSVRAGEAIRIFTGAPIPDGANAIIMQEDVTREGDEITLNEATVQGEFIRRRGGDVAAGQKILGKGERIRPETIALLAAQGIGSIAVGGQVNAAIISTGDELQAPGTVLGPGEIYDANAPMLRALLQRLGVRVVSVTHCRDEAGAIEAAVRAGSSSDVMVISGGVSVGARDLVKPALSAIGAELDLWRVAIKPGKPFLFGHAERCAIFGLPGNPVSAFVTFLLFVRPAVLALMGAGAEAVALPGTTAELLEEVANDGARPHYMRGVLRDGGFAPIGRQESHALFGLSRSNGLLLVGPGETLSAGSAVSVLTWE